MGETDSSRGDDWEEAVSTMTRGLFLGDRREGDLGGGLEGAFSSPDSILCVGVILGEDLMEEALALVLGTASEER